MKNSLALTMLLTAFTLPSVYAGQTVTVTVEEMSMTEAYMDQGATTSGGRGGGAGWEDGKDRPIRGRRNHPYMIDPDPTNPFPGPSSDRMGQVVSAARDVVALGETIYELVTKGKPTNQTEYAPVSVVPRGIDKAPVDPFELEGFSMPVQRKFKATIRTTTREVVKFEYMVIYSYGGRFNGTGRYIAGAQIIPVSIKTSMGWNFSATMKVGGIMNHGSVVSPVAGLMLTLNFKANGWAKSVEQNETVHITGLGQVKAYNRN